jgi:hypothetical protein
MSANLTTSHEPVERPTAQRGSRAERWRLGLAIGGSLVAFAAIPLGVLPILFALPLIGILLAWAAGPDHLLELRTVRTDGRNVAFGVVAAGAAGVVALQTYMQPLLIQTFGLEQYELVISLLAVLAMALPLGMRREAPSTVVDGIRPVATRRNLVLLFTVVVTAAMWYAVGESFMLIMALVIGAAVVVGVRRIRSWRRGLVETGLLRHPLAPGLGLHRLQLAGVVVMAGLLAAVCLPGTFDILRISMTSGQYHALVAGYLAGLALLVLLALVPDRRVYVGSLLLVAATILFVAAQLVATYSTAKGAVTISSPLPRPWYVAQGGHAELVNYHHVTSTQSDALDIVETVNGRNTRPGGHGLESHYIYGEPVLAPASGTVTEVVDKHADLSVGKRDSDCQSGNHIVLSVGAGRYVEFSHLQHGSTRVSRGDHVTAGQPLARVGNSGNTDLPHLHIQAMNRPTFPDCVSQIDDPVGLLHSTRTYPLLFRDVTLTRGDDVSGPLTADPRRGDVVAPAGH